MLLPQPSQVPSIRFSNLLSCDEVRMEDSPDSLPTRGVNTYISRNLHFFNDDIIKLHLQATFEESKKSQAAPMIRRTCAGTGSLSRSFNDIV